MPTSTTSLPYTITCVECNHSRIVSQRKTARVLQLSRRNPFTCTDIGIRCNQSQEEEGFFISLPPSSVSDISPPQPPPPSITHVEPTLPNVILWRKLIKHYGSIPYYDGTANLTKLISWKKGLLEAFTLLKIPVGWEQVLAAVQFLKGIAKEWWDEVIGQSLGQELQQFEEVYDVLHERFIL